MLPNVPRPEDWKELERLVVRLAREYLKDPHATLYGTQGHGQHGLDVLARDQRPTGSGKLWAFQAKDYVSTRLQPSHLQKLVPLLQGYPYWRDIDTFVVVTTSTVSPQVHDKAEELSGQLQLNFRVWEWERFSELLSEHCGSGPWLSRAERLDLRARYCRWAAKELRQAGLLYPLVLPTMDPTDIRLEDVLIPRVLRFVPRMREGRAREASGQHTEALGGASRPQPVSAVSSKETGMTPGRFEGRLVEWLQPREPTDKPLLLVLAPIGTGKTVAFLQAEAELAERAHEDLENPLPLRLRAVELVGVAFDELFRRKGFPDLERLWVDPLCGWVLLVDGLDEVDERAQRDVLRTLLALHDTRRVMGIAVSCRTSHDHPRLFPEALRVELPPWSDEESAMFLRQWERTPQGGELHEEIRALLDSDPSLRANALCNTLLALRGPKGGEPRTGRAWLFRPFVDDLFRAWADVKGTTGWVELQESFEQMALKEIEQGGVPLPRRVLEAALARAQGSDTGIGKAVDAACRLGLIRLTDGDTWDIPLRAIAEYLAAGALLRVTDEDFTRACGQPWAGEVARLALDRRWQFAPEQMRPLLQRLLKRHAGDRDEHLLRRTLVVVQTARDLGLGPEVIPELPGHLRRLLSDEVSSWRRRHLGSAVRELSRKGGALWDAVWRELEPLLLTSGNRATWLAHHERDDVKFWLARLLEQDLKVRVVAIQKLERWNHQPDVQEVLLWQLLDTSRGPFPNAHGEPALAAAAVLRTVPRNEELLATLRAGLGGTDPRIAGVAAVALLPGDADTNMLLSALKWFFLRWCMFPVVREAIEAHRDHPEGRAWLECNWPRVLTEELDDVSRHFTSSEEPGDALTPPPSQHVRGDLLWSIIPALRNRELLEKVAAGPFPRHSITGVYCFVAETAPDAAVELLRGEARFYPWDAQEALGRAALQRPELGDALVDRWDKGADARLPTNFPGLALEPLAARGLADPMRVYAEWLPKAVNLLISFPRRVSPAALRQPAIHEAARFAAIEAWYEATRGRREPSGEVVYLGPSPLGALLQCLWPSWQDAPEVRDGLLEWTRGDDLEKLHASLRAWMQGEIPPEVARSLYERLDHREAWPTRAPWFWSSNLPLWLAAAARAGILTALEHVLRFLAEELEPSEDQLPVVYQSCAYLLRLHPEEAKHLVERAALVWPLGWDDNEELALEDVEHLVSAVPEIWAQACLDLYEQYGHQVAWPFLRMMDRLREWLPPRSTMGRKLVEATRELAGSRWLWGAKDFLGPYVRVDDEAKRLLFLMGEPLAPMPNEPS